MTDNESELEFQARAAAHSKEKEQTDAQAAQDWLQRMESTAEEYTEIIPHSDLHSGMVVEMWLYGAWRECRVEFDYPRQVFYLLLFDGGQSVGTMLINPRAQLRRSK